MPKVSDWYIVPNILSKYLTKSFVILSSCPIVAIMYLFKIQQRRVSFKKLVEKKNVFLLKKLKKPLAIGPLYTQNKGNTVLTGQLLNGIF